MSVEMVTVTGQCFTCGGSLDSGADLCPECREPVRAVCLHCGRERPRSVASCPGCGETWPDRPAEARALRGPVLAFPASEQRARVPWAVKPSRLVSFLSGFALVVLVTALTVGALAMVRFGETPQFDPAGAPFPPYGASR